MINIILILCLYTLILILVYIIKSLCEKYNDLMGEKEDEIEGFRDGGIVKIAHMYDNVATTNINIPYVMDNYDVFLKPIAGPVKGVIGEGSLITMVLPKEYIHCIRLYLQSIVLTHESGAIPIKDHHKFNLPMELYGRLPFVLMDHIDIGNLSHPYVTFEPVYTMACKTSDPYDPVPTFIDRDKYPKKWNTYLECVAEKQKKVYEEYLEKRDIIATSLYYNSNIFNPINTAGAGGCASGWAVPECYTYGAQCHQNHQSVDPKQVIYTYMEEKTKQAEAKRPAVYSVTNIGRFYELKKDRDIEDGAIILVPVAGESPRIYLYNKKTDELEMLLDSVELPEEDKSDEPPVFFSPASDDSSNVG